MGGSVLCVEEDELEIIDHAERVHPAEEIMAIALAAAEAVNTTVDNATATICKPIDNSLGLLYVEYYLEPRKAFNGLLHELITAPDFSLPSPSTLSRLDQEQDLVKDENDVE